MAYTQADLDVLDSAIASGALKVTTDGESVEYRSLAELERARDRVANSLSQTASSVRRYGAYCKGV